MNEPTRFHPIQQWLKLFCVLILGFTLNSCQTGEDLVPTQEPQNLVRTDTSDVAETVPSEAQATPTADPKDPDQLLKMWETSMHADTFVVSEQGENNSCARCHDRYNYIPSIDDIPESCFSCKFEVDDPPPYIAEENWKHVDCMICHRIEKKEVQPQYAWLEFALIEEYSDMPTVTDLCNQCHLAEGIPGHISIVVDGDHPDYVCTECHNAHDLSASCSSANCHQDVTQAGTIISGHDEDHANVSCSACHDAGGLEIGYVEDLGIWTTLHTTEKLDETRPFTSHNIILESPCERCHFPGNLWGLTESVEKD